jgi:general secretion pathway protein G
MIKSKKNNRGFTLIELLVVMIILGLLAALVAPKFFNKVSDSKIKTTKTQIELLGSALDGFYLDVGRYPTTSEGLNALLEKPANVPENKWKGPYLPKKIIPKDAWGNEFIYKSPGENGLYDLLSYGADGQPGGEGDAKDIVSWE